MRDDLAAGVTSIELEEIEVATGQKRQGIVETKKIKLLNRGDALPDPGCNFELFTDMGEMDLRAKVSEMNRTLVSVEKRENE